MSSRPDDLVAIELPGDLVSRVENRLPRTNWDTPDDYIAFALEEMLYEIEASTSDGFELVDEEAVKDRLQSLGYLDE